MSILTSKLSYKSFHSISFPNEWGVVILLCYMQVSLEVSIQLVSPTSGEW